ncbi:unnamed protein product [Nippostrongylus brasiliensis]|uniref:Reverse transcriptase domain-containing protein n=1 Tax=Nippostrongylus brasiliensis TaxID=27835 RepID=A0A0N4YNZ1_NIPBR|nr:unnamed protein product [Nippostrongylus brasiliensis]
MLDVASSSLQAPERNDGFHIIQAHARTADSSEELLEEFYEELQDLIRSQKSNCIIIGGDFSVRIGPRRPGDRFIGPNSVEIRNDTGLANFCETPRLYHGNSHFFKTPKRRWTHCSPNGQHVHELDHMLCNRKVFIEVHLTQIRQKQTRIKRIDIEALQSMMDSVSFDMFDDIDEDFSRITNIITTLASKSSEADPNHSSHQYCVLELSNGTELPVIRVQLPDYDAPQNMSLSSPTSQEGQKAGHQNTLKPSHVIKETPPKFRRESAMGACHILFGLDGAPNRSSRSDETQFRSNLVDTQCRVRCQAGNPSTILARKCVRSGAEVYSICDDLRDTHCLEKIQNNLAGDKEGDKGDLANYRPITLLPILYKVFTRCLLSCMKRTLDEEQPIEHAGFRRKFSILDHILTCCRVVETALEYHEPLVLTLIDYHKSLDSEPFHRYVEVAVERGVRQGDPISPNLFLACLESIIHRCNCNEYGISIDGRKLNHLRFADDIVLITRSTDQASRMLEELHKEGANFGPTTNMLKTKLNEFADENSVRVQGDPLEEVTAYVYLGRFRT